MRSTILIKLINLDWPDGAPILTAKSINRNASNEAAAMTSPSTKALHDLWRLAALPEGALSRATLTGEEPALPSSFAVSTAAQSSIAAAALAAAELGAARGGAKQDVSVDIRDAALECTGFFSIDGRIPEAWDK